MIAIGVIRGLRKRIKYTKWCKCRGFDDIQTSSLISPSLTTVKQPSYDIGYKASEILINYLRGDKESFDELIFKQIESIRDSTKVNNSTRDINRYKRRI